MGCKSEGCMVMYDNYSCEYVVMSDCSGTCKCPADKMELPLPGTPSHITVVDCAEPKTITPPGRIQLQDLIHGELSYADAWLMQRKCDAFCEIGCEWSKGDGIVKRIGFKSAKFPEPRYQVLQGDRPEIVLFGGMSDGSSNIANGLPDPWIIGYAELKLPESSGKRRINIAGFTSFNVDQGDA